jgi:hypothetical protein
MRNDCRANRQDPRTNPVLPRSCNRLRSTAVNHVTYDTAVEVWISRRFVNDDLHLKTDCGSLVGYDGSHRVQYVDRRLHSGKSISEPDIESCAGHRGSVEACECG